MQIWSQYEMLEDGQWIKVEYVRYERDFFPQQWLYWQTYYTLPQDHLLAARLTWQHERNECIDSMLLDSEWKGGKETEEDWIAYCEWCFAQCGYFPDWEDWVVGKETEEDWIAYLRAMRLLSRLGRLGRVASY